jgi:hypothetical protein
MTTHIRFYRTAATGFFGHYFEVVSAEHGKLESRKTPLKRDPTS